MKIPRRSRDDLSKATQLRSVVVSEAVSSHFLVRVNWSFCSLLVFYILELWLPM